MEQAIGFLSTKAKETDSGGSIYKRRGSVDLAADGKQDTQDSRRFPRGPPSDRGNWMDSSESQKEDDRQHNKELRGRLRDLHYEKLSKAVLSSITEI